MKRGDKYKCSACDAEVLVAAVNYYTDQIPKQVGIEYECANCESETEEYFPLSEFDR